LAKKIILIFLVLFILVIGGLTVYVSAIDWNEHKEKIAEKFSELTGEKIEFTGPVNVSLLPVPTLKAQNVNIINPKKSTEKLASITDLSTEVTLSSLLKGAPDVRSLALTGVEIWIDINDKNELNWKTNKPKDLAGDNANTRLQSLSIQDALLHYNNEYLGINFDLTQVNADIQSESLYGPYRLDGNFVKDQDHFGIAVSIGDFSLLTDVPLNFAVTHPKSESFLRYDGVYMANEQAFKGDFSGGSQKTADFANILSGMEILTPEYNVPLQFSVGVLTDDEKIALSSFIIKYGNLLEGSGNILIPLQAQPEEKRTIDIKYQMVNLDLRPLLSVFKAEYETFKKNGSVYKPDTYYNIKADLSSERIILNSGEQGYLENVSAKGSWLDNALNLEEFYAACSGNTVLTMNGSLIEEKQTPQYFIKTSITGSDFQNFLTSLGLNVTSYTQGAYRNVDLSFNLSGNNKAVSFSDLKFSMDKMKIEGTIGINLNDEGNLYEIQVTADDLNLDTYLPENMPDASVVDNLKKDAEELGFLKWLKLHAVVHADNLIFRGAAFNKLNLIFTTEDGNLNVTELLAEDVLNSSLKLSGIVSNLGGIDINIADLNYDLHSSGMNEIIDKFALPLPEWEIFKAKNFQAAGSYNGTLSKGNININASADETKFDYSGSIEQAENFKFDGRLNFKTTNLLEFVNKTGGTLKNNASMHGALNCQAAVNGAPEEWQFNNTECLFGIANYKGEGKIKTDKNKTEITAKITADELNIENLVESTEDKRNSSVVRLREDDFLSRPDWSRNSVSFDIYKNLILDIDLTAAKAFYKNDTYANLHTHILNSENILRLNDLSALANGIAVTGNLLINYAQNPVIKGGLSLENIKLANLGGAVYNFISGTLNLKTNFEVPAVSIEDFVNNFTGDINFSGEDIRFKGFDFAKINKDINDRQYSKGLFQQVRDNLQSGETLFSSASGNIKAENGSFKIENFQFAGSAAVLDVTGMLGLNEWKILTDFAVTLPDTKKFSFSLSGMINKPELDINITDIVRQYDEHWQQVEASEKAEKERKQQELNKKMENAQLEVQEITDSLNSLIPQFEAYKKESENNDGIAWYTEKLARLNDISKDVDEMRGKSHIPEFTDTDIKTIFLSCSKYKKEIAQMNKELPQHYLLDVSDRIEARKTAAENLNAREKELEEKFKNTQNEHFNALLKLDAAYLMMENEQLKNKQKAFENAGLSFTEKYEKFKADFSDIPSESSAQQKKEFAEKLRLQIEQMQQEEQNMTKLFTEIDDELKTITKEQQTIFDKKKAEEEAKRKKQEQENAGNLLKESSAITGTKPAKTEEKDSSEVLSAPAAGNIAETKAETADASMVKNNLLQEIKEQTQESPSTAGVIHKSYEQETSETPQKQTSGAALLREAEGAVKKATGKIIVK